MNHSTPYPKNRPGDSLYFTHLHLCTMLSKRRFIQVGDGYADHATWQRPEDPHPTRPTYLVGYWNGGSDVAGETAASMAATAIVFKDSDPSYSATLLSHAKTLYTFADDYR